jgi:hypothetical protein
MVEFIELLNTCIVGGIPITGLFFGSFEQSEKIDKIKEIAILP